VYEPSATPVSEQLVDVRRALELEPHAAAVALVVVFVRTA
jgi:hypothetical protein